MKSGSRLGRGGLAVRARNIAAFIGFALLGLHSVQAATITVQDTGDGAANAANCPGANCRLRDALAKAADNDTIDFSVTGTITLTSAELDITKSVTIRGPGANQLIVSGNHASQVFYIASGHTVTIAGLTVTGGTGVGSIVRGSGGGIYHSAGTLTVSTCTITGNSTGGSGGGIYNISGGTLTVVNSTVSGNSAASTGGGIDNEGTLRAANSTVYGNSAAQGGGFHNTGTLTLINSTVSGNSANTDGGGIFNASGTTMTATSSTITGNRADSDGNGSGTGGGIGADGTETLKNTIVAGNFRGTGSTADDINRGTIETANNNLIGDSSTSGGISNGSNGNIVGNSGSGTIDINTVLDTTLADNGGPTQTHALVSGSPALNAGNNALLPADTFDLDGDGNTAEPLPVDQRGPGFPRVANTTVDIGAFEGAMRVVTKTADTADGTCDADCSLREAITAATPGDTVLFSSLFNTPQTITLTLGELPISKDLKILGPGADKLAVDGNHASRVFHVGSGTTVTIFGVTIRNGLASGSFPANAGAGIYNDHATLTVTNSSLSNNSADLGGGIYNNGGQSGSATLTVTGSTLSGNSATALGAGISNDGSGSGSATLTVANSTFSGNSSSSEGGGIFNQAFEGTAILMLTNSTLSGNSATNSGGGISNFGGSGTATLELGNTILNAGASGANIANDSGTVTSDGHNLSSDAAGGDGTTAPGALLNRPGDIRNTDPKLGPLADNGGPTLTHALLPGSPALDAGDNTLASNAGLTTDQRATGFSRVRDAASDADTTQTVDIGAFEADPSIEDITDKSTDEDTALSFTFKVADSATPFDSITASSSNTTLVPNGNITVGSDTPSTRALSITPASNQSGTTTITVTVTKTINGKPISMSDTFVLTVTPVNDPPVANDQSVTMDEDTSKAITLTGSDVEGDPLTFSVVTGPTNGTLTGTPPDLTYTPNPNYNGPDSFTFKANDGQADSNTATVSITVNDVPEPTPTPTATPSPTPTATPTPTPNQPQPLNLSTRAFVSVGDNVAIGGFIITGDSPKKILVRAIGPSLDIDGKLLDPVLELHGPDGFATLSNDDWQQASNAGDIPTALQPKDQRESAILVTLDPGAYTAIVRGKSNTTGIALVEIYDAAFDTPSQLANLSTRALVQTDDKVMIGGFIVGGAEGNSNVIVRALGPSLADDGVPNVLADPFLDIRNKDGTRLTSNDNWKDDPSAVQVSQSGVAPTDDLESALYLSVPSGEYTAIVSGANGETGVGLVEIYHVQAMAAGIGQRASK